MCNQKFADQIKALQEQITLLTARSTVKEHYSVKEFAALKGLKPKTVRDYCWEGRLRAVRQKKRWAIPHTELLRYERDGLLTPTLRQKV